MISVLSTDKINVILIGNIIGDVKGIDSVMNGWELVDSGKILSRCYGLLKID